MKLRLFSSICLLATSSVAFASHTSNAGVDSSHLYVGAFGGFGKSNHVDASQYGTIYLIEANGGPLAVNALGDVNDDHTSFFGAQFGYQGQERGFSASSQWSIRPAVELEGYFLNKHTFDGTLVNNTARLPEHAFFVELPMNRTVFLANAVLSFNSASSFHPYIGFGIGNAIVEITGASATQVSPAEVGINHFNANTGDTISTFAGQVKLGLGYDINKCVGFFAEYRWLYLADSHFVFGSTIADGHPETSAWQVNLDAQKYHLGSIGVRINW